MQKWMRLLLEIQARRKEQLPTEFKENAEGRSCGPHTHTRSQRLVVPSHIFLQVTAGEV